MYTRVTTLAVLTVLATGSGATTALAAPALITLALCPANQLPADFLFKQDYFAIDGSIEYLVITTAPVNETHCTSTQVQIDGDLLWAGQASAEHLENAITQVGLQGIFNTVSPVVREVIAIGDSPSRPAQLSESPTPLPLNESVLRHFVPRPFGIEERATTPEQNHLICSPGNQTAGALFQSQRPWTSGSNLQLEFRARGHGRLEFAVGNSAQDMLQQPIIIGEVEPSEEITQVYNFALPDNALPWTSFTVACPPGSGSLVMSSLIVRSSTLDSATNSATGSAPQSTDDVEATESPSARILQRGAWLWSPELWRSEPGFVWQAQAQEQLSEIYISVEIDASGRIADSALLANFIAEASSRSLRVWAVIGDPHDVLPASQVALERRIEALLTYNSEASEPAQLAGVQLDIEPYLLSGFSRAQHQWRERYVAVIERVHTLLDGQMTMDMVMPAWWGNHPAWGELLLARVPVSNTRISIMNYHTAPERLLVNAEPFLNWGQRTGVPVQIGLESGPLQDENQRRYRTHVDSGELWLIPLGEQSVFILLDQRQSNLDGTAFAYAFEYDVPASLYTFAGDMARLNAVLRDLEPEWRRWSSFSGISIHGMDDRTQMEGNR